jgi:shikimate kinase
MTKGIRSTAKEFGLVDADKLVSNDIRKISLKDVFEKEGEAASKRLGRHVGDVQKRFYL